MVFEISCFLCPNLQRALTKKKYSFLLFSPGHLLIINYKLSKFEAHSCYNFLNILITKFHYDPLKGGITPQREIIQIKKIWVSYFLMKNASMKFQNRILKDV